MTDPLLRGVVMIAISDGKPVATKLYDEPGEAQTASSDAAASGKYEAVLLANPYQVRRRP